MVIEPEITPFKSQLPGWACEAETPQKQKEGKKKNGEKKAAPGPDTNNGTFTAIYF